jgi:predicted GIY-YIG superfamily endonuclease
MHKVYVLSSKKFPSRCYIGITQNLDKRLNEHNNEKSIYARKCAPWQLETYITFKKKNLAEDFERYLKSGSGFAFMKRRLI